MSQHIDIIEHGVWIPPLIRIQPSTLRIINVNRNESQAQCATQPDSMGHIERHSMDLEQLYSYATLLANRATGLREQLFGGDVGDAQTSERLEAKTPVPSRPLDKLPELVSKIGFQLRKLDHELERLSEL